MSQLYVTFHAIERYHERYRPNDPIEVVQEEIKMLAYMARPMRERTLLGDEQWTAEGVVFVVKRDSGNARVAVTVLPEQKAVDPLEGVPEEVREELEAKKNAQKDPRVALAEAKQRMQETEAHLKEAKKKHTDAVAAYMAAKKVVLELERV